MPSAPAHGTLGRADAAPGGGGLHVIEHGFTQLNHDHEVSLGTIVENTSNQVAYRARATFSYRDAHGRSAVPDKSRRLRIEIPIIRPGQRIPVGASGYVRLDSFTGQPVSIASMHLALGSVTWAPSSPTFSTLTAEPKSFTNMSVINGSLSATLIYTVHSGYCRTLFPRGVSMVFRDTAETIVGGNLDPNDTVCTPGTTSGRALIYGSVPKSAIAVHTDVYPYCDLAPPAAAPGTPALAN